MVRLELDVDLTWDRRSMASELRDLFFFVYEDSCMMKLYFCSIRLLFFGLAMLLPIIPIAVCSIGY